MSLNKKRILVTGAGGFVGRHLCRALDAVGACVVGMVRSPDAGKPYSGEQYVADISDLPQIRQLVQVVRPECVVHLASDKNRGLDLAEYRAGYETNLLGSLNLIDACQESANLARFVYLGSCEEYGQQTVPFDESSKELPVSAYGVSKLAVTELLQALARAGGFPAVVLRPSVVYGPGQSEDMFLPALIRALVHDERFGMSPGEQTRDFLYVDDLVNAILRALTASHVDGKVINVSSALPVRICDLASQTARLMGAGEERLLDLGARDYRPGEAMHYWARNALASTLLDWTPGVSLEDGLRRTIAYFRAEMPAN